MGFQAPRTPYLPPGAALAPNPHHRWEGLHSTPPTKFQLPSRQPSLLQTPWLPPSTAANAVFSSLSLLSFLSLPAHQPSLQEAIVCMNKGCPFSQRGDVPPTPWAAISLHSFLHIPEKPILRKQRYDRITPPLTFLVSSQCSWTWPSRPSAWACPLPGLSSPPLPCVSDSRAFHTPPCPRAFAQAHPFIGSTLLRPPLTQPSEFPSGVTRWAYSWEDAPKNPGKPPSRPGPP